LDDPQKKLNDFYQRQSLSADRARAILAEGRALAGQQRRRALFWRTAAVAATIAIAGGLVWSNLPSPPAANAQATQVADTTTLSLPSIQAEVINFFETPNYQLDRVSLDQPELLAFLQAQGAPAALQVPGELNSLDNLGCHVLEVDSEQVYIMCFYLDGVPRDANGVAMLGKKPMMTAAATEPTPPPAPDPTAAPAMMKKPATLVHLVAIPRAKFKNAPLAGDPVQQSSDGTWSFATWARGDVVYVAASPTDAERFSALAKQLSG